MTEIAASGGWAGAGLLGAVLGWLLLRHLPEKDRQLKEWVDQERLDCAKQVLAVQVNSDARLEALKKVVDDMMDFMRARAEEAARRKGITK